MHTHRRRPEHSRQSRIHVLNEDLTHVGGQPLVEHLAQETPVGGGGRGAARHAVPVLPIQERRSPGAPAALGLSQVGGAHTLNNGNELQVAGPKLVTEVAIHLRPVLLVRGVDRTQDVRLHARASQSLPAAHNHRVGTAPTTVKSVSIVHVSGSIDGNSHEKLVVSEKTRPLITHQRPVRLQSMAHTLGGATVALTQLHEALEKAEAAQGRLPALPQHRHLAVTARLKVRLHVALQRLLRHGLRRRIVEQLLRQEKAILAVQVTCRTRRLRHHRKGDLGTHERSPPAHTPTPGEAVAPPR